MNPCQSARGGVAKSGFSIKYLAVRSVNGRAARACKQSAWAGWPYTLRLQMISAKIGGTAWSKKIGHNRDHIRYD